MVLPASSFKRSSWHSSPGNKSSTCSSFGSKLLMETFRQSSSSYSSIYSNAPIDSSKSNSCTRTSISESSHFGSKERRSLKKTQLNSSTTATKFKRSSKRLIASTVLHQPSSRLNNRTLSPQQSLQSICRFLLSRVSTRGQSLGLLQGRSKTPKMPKITTEAKSLRNPSPIGPSGRPVSGLRKTYPRTRAGPLSNKTRSEEMADREAIGRDAMGEARKKGPERGTTEITARGTTGAEMTEIGREITKTETDPEISTEWARIAQAASPL